MYLLLTFFVLFNLIFIITSVSIAHAGTKVASAAIPELVIPVYDKLKEMHLDIPLVTNG